MAVVTDLSWQQLLVALPANSIVVQVGPPAKVMIDVGLLTGKTTEALTDLGVVQLLVKLLTSALIAQQTVNENQIPGERLTAFSNPASGGAVNGYVPITRSLTARAELASATNVVGQIG